MEGIHLVCRLRRWPMFEGHAVGSNENAGTIFAIMAMHENGFRGMVAKDGEELNDLFVGGSGKPSDRDVHEMQTQSFYLLAFGRDALRIFAAKVYDRGHAQLSEGGKRREAGLGAAVEMIVNFSSVGDSLDTNFFRVSRLQDGGG